MNNFKPKLLSAGLGVVMLFGAVAPLTAAAAQTNTPQIQATVTTASAKADMGAMVPTLQSQRPVAGDGQNTAPSPAGQSQTQDGETDENDAAQQAQLVAQAQITEAEAIAAAQAAYPGSTVTVEELDGEGGKVLYDLKVQPADGSKGFEAAVDAVTGELLVSEPGD